MPSYDFSSLLVHIDSVQHTGLYVGSEQPLLTNVHNFLGSMSV